jgi:hypothetical protein
LDLPAWISPLLEKSKKLPAASGKPWRRFARTHRLRVHRPFSSVQKSVDRNEWSAEHDCLRPMPAVNSGGIPIKRAQRMHCGRWSCQAAHAQVHIEDERGAAIFGMARSKLAQWCTSTVAAMQRSVDYIVCREAKRQESDGGRLAFTTGRWSIASRRGREKSKSLDFQLSRRG